MDKVQFVKATCANNDKHKLLIIEDNDQTPPWYCGFATWEHSTKPTCYFNTAAEVFNSLRAEILISDKPYKDIFHTGASLIDTPIINAVLL